MTEEEIVDAISKKRDTTGVNVAFSVRGKEVTLRNLEGEVIVTGTLKDAEDALDAIAASSR